MNARIRGCGFNHEQRQRIMSNARKDCCDEVMWNLGSNMDAMILYTLAENFNFSKKDLRKFHMLFILNTKFLGAKFSMEDEPKSVAEFFLNRGGVDLDRWRESDLALWDRLPDKEEWYLKDLSEFNEMINERVNKIA